MIAWWLLALLGCADNGPDPDTVIGNLRVVSVVADPPEVAPGDDITVDIEVYDRQGGSIDVMGWFCTPLGGSALTGGCAEAGPTARPLSAFTVVATDAGLTTRGTFHVPEELAALVPGDGVADDLIRPVFWGLACRSGACPVIDAVQDDPAPGSASWSDVVTQLGRPTLWLPDVPLDDSSLATRFLMFTGAGDPYRATNPPLVAVSAPTAADPGEIVPFVFRSGDVIVYPFASDGGFLLASYGAANGLPVTLQWQAPKRSGSVDLVVVVEDQQGGSAVWRGTVTVR